MERLSGLRWMEKKTAAERQDNFSHFSGGGQRRRQGERDGKKERCEEVERDRVTERKRRTAGDKTECESEGGKRRRRQDRVHCDMLCTDD